MMKEVIQSSIRQCKFIEPSRLCWAPSWPCLQTKMAMKTKELLIEEHRARDTSLLQPVRIKTEDVESVKTFKYLGTVLDSNLSFTTHVDTVCKKANQRMYLIRKL